MKRHLLPALAALLLLTGCATTPTEPTPAPAPQSTDMPDMSVPSWKVGEGYLSRYIISQQNGTQLECVVYTGGGLDCNWQGGNQ